jgi:hypothetical protein
LLYTETLKAEENPKLRDPSARQIDFRQFFPPPPDISPASHPILGSEVPETAITKRRSTNPLRCAHVGGSDWANVVFVLVTIVGGFFLSVHYLGGPETFRAKTTWPREFLYQRPAGNEPYSKTDAPASSQRNALAPKPMLIVQQQDNPDGRTAPAQVNHPVVAPPLPGAPNSGLPFVPATTSNLSSVGSQESAARGGSGSSQASSGGTTSGSTGPTAPTSAGPTDKNTKTPAVPSRKGSGGKQDSKPTKESCVKPDNRQMTNAQKLTRIDALRRSQENLAAKATRNFNGPPGGAIRTFNSNRAGSLGAPGNGFGGRH